MSVRLPRISTHRRRGRAGGGSWLERSSVVGRWASRPVVAWSERVTPRRRRCRRRTACVRAKPRGSRRATTERTEEIVQTAIEFGRTDTRLERRSQGQRSHRHPSGLIIRRTSGRRHDWGWQKSAGCVRRVALRLGDRCAPSALCATAFRGRSPTECGCGWTGDDISRNSCDALTTNESASGISP
jgi:hypothetical protein